MYNYLKLKYASLFAVLVHADMWSTVLLSAYIAWSIICGISDNFNKTWENEKEKKYWSGWDLNRGLREC